MTLRQLRCFAAVIKAGFNLSVAARALHISQPGISRYIKLLEEELQAPLFVHSHNRLVSLTPAGQAIANIANRALLDIESIPAVAKDYCLGELGRLVIATNPGHARYSLPPVMERFIKCHPRVRVRIRQGNSSQVAQWVLSGDAELFISTGPTDPNPELLLLPCSPIHPIILTPGGHPLARKRKLKLNELCSYPIITYDSEFAFHANVMRSFHAHGLEPDILLSATDAEIMKIYVRAGLGIAIVAHSAFDPRIDQDLRRLDARDLFHSTMLHIGLKRNAYLTKHLMRFIEFFAPHVKVKGLSNTIAD